MEPPAGRDFAPISDTELHRLGHKDLGAIIRRLEQERIAIMAEHGRLMKDVNKRMQIHLMEIRGLKEVNQRLQDDNQEMRDLCCFLDDDRQKSRKLAREWQRFGRYTSSVMKNEVTAYHEKLNELEGRQQSLIDENVELKELCVYLDLMRGSERGERASPLRDQGDGDSLSESPTSADVAKDVATTDVAIAAKTSSKSSPTAESEVTTAAMERTSINGKFV